MFLDVKKFMDELHEYLGRAIKPIIERLKALEDRQPEPGPQGEPGEKGEPGQDGKSVTVDDILPEISRLVDKAANEIPSPEPGPQGEPGEKGEPGQDGKSVTVDDVLPALIGEVKAEIAKIPIPKNGEDGAPGKDGKSVTVDDIKGFLEGAFAKWALEFERRAHDVQQRAIDKIPIPKDGKDGEDGLQGSDGFGLDDFTMEFDGERTVTFKFQCAELVREKEFKFPGMIYRGVFREDNTHEQGDTVTSGGSLWVAKVDNPKGRPGLPDSDWQLAVKKGRDGRDGEKGSQGPQGEKGRPGNDLTKLDIGG